MATDYPSSDVRKSPLANPIDELCKTKDELQNMSDAEFPKKWLSRTLSAELLKYISESNAVDPEDDAVIRAEQALKDFKSTENGISRELHSALLAYRNVTKLPGVPYQPALFPVK